MLASLLDLSRKSVLGRLEESIGYGVITEMFIEHKFLLGRPSFVILPQLSLPWNPHRPTDLRNNKPDIGFGRLTNTGAPWLQGGAEEKAPITMMRGLPPPNEVTEDGDFRDLIQRATAQASDQVKAAVKNGAVPCDCPIKWVVGCGPYFIIRAFGPYNQDELTTRLHRPNDSGDWLMTDLNREVQTTARVKCIEEPVHLIGTSKAAEAVHEYLIEGMRLYDPDPKRQYVVPNMK